MVAEWLNALHQPDYEWLEVHPGATDEQIERLAQYCRRPLPLEYETLLRVSNGGVITYQEIWLIRFWSTQECLVWPAAYGLTATNLPGGLAFGDDGGGEGLVFDIRPTNPDGAYPVYAVNYVSIGWDEALKVASSFKDLLLLRRRLLQEHDQTPL